MANHEYFTGKISREVMLDRQKKILDFPNILRNKVLTDSELLILGIILDIGTIEREVIVDRLEKLFEENEFHITGDNAAIKLQNVFWLAKYFGKRKEYRKTIEYCDFGIARNEELRTIYLIEYFTYYKALSYKRLGEISKFKKSLYEAIIYVEIIPSQTRRDRFKDIIRKDLGIEPLEFVRDYIDLVKLK